MAKEWGGTLELSSGESPRSTRPASRPYLVGVSKKSAKIAAIIDGLRGRALDAHYLGYFDCFHRQLYYEAHDVLEELWLADRHGADGDFYKGLIQLAGAFVHLQKHLSPEYRKRMHRLRPAAALLRLAHVNLSKYPEHHEKLDVTATLALIEDWLGKLDAGKHEVNPFNETAAPPLPLLGNE